MDEEVTSFFSFCQTILTFKISETQFRRICGIVCKEPFLDRHAKFESEFTLLLENDDFGTIVFYKVDMIGIKRKKISYDGFTIDLDKVDDLVLKTLLASWLGIECVEV